MNSTPEQSQWPEPFLAALDAAKGKSATPKELDRVAKLHGAEAARWAFGQWALRERARAKFADADSMFFVAEALEQASHERIAAYHAAQFPSQEPIVDLTCGIGSDLRAFARRGPATGVELDEERARCARANSDSHVIVGDCLEVAPQASYYFCDPSRRDMRGRASADLDRHLPNPEVVLETFSHARLILLRLSPLVRDHDLRTLGPRCEFVSLGRSCREALVYAGSEARPGWMAIHLESGESLEPISELAPLAPQPQAWLFDIDPAALRSGCLSTLASTFGLAFWGRDHGFLTGSAEVISPWLRAYKVLESGKFELKVVRQMLAKHDWYTKTLKPRGVSISPEETLKKLPREGSVEVDLLVVGTASGASVSYCIPTKL